MLPILLSLTVAVAPRVQTPAPEDASAPTSPPVADTVVYPVLNHGRPAGAMTVVREGDVEVVRYAHVDRNRGRWVATRTRFGAAGRPVEAESRPMSRDGVVGEPNESFRPAGDSLRWRRGSASGTLPGAAQGYYRIGNATPWDLARLARYLLEQPGAQAPLLPTGEAQAEVVAEVSVATTRGRERARFVVVRGQGPGSAGVWLDERGDLLASEVAWFITVRPDAQDALPALRAAEVAFHEGRAEALASEVHGDVLAGALVIRGGNLFEAETGVVRPGTTVVVEGDRITAVGPDGSIDLPAGARVIDAGGKTIVPGLWDMHSHYGLDSQAGGAILQLARGLTTVRDLASDLDVAVSHARRADAGTILSPRVILGGFVEGPGAWAGPTEVLVRTEDEARAWVARYDSLGYRQIKLYNLVHPDLVPTIAREARGRGLRLSGHVPRGMSVEAAVELGFDEINHAAFLFSTFFPDSLYVPGMRPYSGVAAAVAPGFDVDGAGMDALIAFLAERGTVVDGTFNLWMGGRAALNGEGSPAAASYRRLIARLYEAGVPLVPGTDNSTGSTYLDELMLYEHAGIPAPEVLRIATIGSARVMGDDADYGSIAPGKVADLLVVDGDPSQRIADLANLELVVRGGRAYEPDDLYEAAGVTRR